MPTAIPFNTPFPGNGFTECLDKVDVSDFDFWTTLGGTQKGSSPSESEINLSLKNAMAIFWSLNGASGNYNQSGPVNVDFALSIDGDAEIWDNFRWRDLEGVLVSGEFFPPRERVCFASFNGDDFHEDTDEGIDLTFTIFGSVIRLYDGDTSSEGNFVGHGVSNLVRLEQAGGNVFFQSRFSLVSFFNLDAGFADDAEYVDVNGIHAVAAFTDFDENPGASITITENGSEVKCVASDGVFGTEIFIIDKPLDFFTY